jgi:hypothetical protein
MKKTIIVPVGQSIFDRYTDKKSIYAAGNDYQSCSSEIEYFVGKQSHQIFERKYTYHVANLMDIIKDFGFSSKVFEFPSVEIEAITKAFTGEEEFHLLCDNSILSTIAADLTVAYFRKYMNGMRVYFLKTDPIPKSEHNHVIYEPKNVGKLFERLQSPMNHPEDASRHEVLITFAESENKNSAILKACCYGCNNITVKIIF